VKGPDDRAVSFLDRHDRNDGTERGMNVNDVVLAEAENAPQVFSELEPPREARLRSIGVDRLTLPDAYDVGLVTRARDVRGDNVDVMSVAARFAGDDVHVLADAAEVRIVVLGDERDSERTRMLHVCHRERSRWHQLNAASVAEPTLQERHERRLDVRLEL
jgi:hypothetical protein